MPDLLYQFLIRLAVMLPTILIFASLVWLLFRRSGAITPGAPIEPSNLRTWPLSYLLADAALFAVIFAFVAAWLGEGEWTAAIAGGIAALVAVGLGPLVVKRLSVRT
jgi:hypothetical protein